MSASFFEMPSPFPDEPGTLRLIEPPGASRSDLAARLVGGSYGRPFVLDNGTLRLLLFSTDYIQSAMRLADPDTLELAYTRQMMSFLLFHTRIRTLLMIGLGGGSLAKFCHRHLPQARITAIESDADVIAFGAQFNLPPADARWSIVHGDGAAFLAADASRPDVILVDAFDDGGFSPTIATRSFYEMARARLADNGVLVANLTGERADRATHLELIRDPFGDNLLVIPIEDGFNHIVFAFRDPNFEPRWKWIESQAAAMRARYGLDFPAYCKGLVRGRKFSRSGLATRSG